MIYEEPRIKGIGGYALYIEFCNEVSLECNKLVHILYYSLERAKVKGVKELIPAYSSLTIIYNPRIVSYRELTRIVKNTWLEMQGVDVSRLIKPRLIEIPVAYGGEFGPDMPFVVEYSGLSEEEVIRIHSGRIYTCYMLGFTPGFVYLGDVDPRIAVPRLETPRLRILPGSVGIAGKQTGFYGVESPGGWRLIGRTPLLVFNPNRDPPSIIRPGDRVKFKPITAEEFYEIRKLVEKGEYEVKVEVYRG